MVIGLNNKLLFVTLRTISREEKQKTCFFSDVHKELPMASVADCSIRMNGKKPDLSKEDLKHRR